MNKPRSRPWLGLKPRRLSPAKRAGIRDKEDIVAAKQRRAVIDRVNRMCLDKGAELEKEMLGLGNSLRERDIVLHQMQMKLLRLRGPEKFNSAEKALYGFLPSLTGFEERLVSTNKYGVEIGQARWLYERSMRICALMLSLRKPLRKRGKQFEKKWAEKMASLKSKKSELEKEYAANPSPLMEVDLEELYRLASHASDYVNAMKPDCSVFTRIAFNQADRAARQAFKEEKE